MEYILREMQCNEDNCWNGQPLYIYTRGHNSNATQIRAADTRPSRRRAEVQTRLLSQRISPAHYLQRTSSTRARTHSAITLPKGHACRPADKNKCAGRTNRHSAAPRGGGAEERRRTRAGQGTAAARSSHVITGVPSGLGPRAGISVGRPTIGASRHGSVALCAVSVGTRLWRTVQVLR